MGKVANAINAQIKRNGETPENLLIKALYDTLVKHNLTSSIMFQEITDVKYGPKYSYLEYYVKPKFVEFVKEFSKQL